MKRFGLSSKERIKNKKIFEKVYSSGNILFSFDRKFKALYIVEENALVPGVKIAAAVGRKSGIAVWRNRIKRLIKESFRLNKEILTGVCIERSVNLSVVFSPNSVSEKNNKKIKLNDVLPGMIDLMLKIKSKL